MFCAAFACFSLYLYVYIYISHSLSFSHTHINANTYTHTRAHSHVHMYMYTHSLGYSLVPIADNKWTRIATRNFPPQARRDHASCVVNDRMYVFGGYSTDRNSKICFLQDMHEFNIRFVFLPFFFHSGCSFPPYLFLSHIYRIS